MSCTQNIPSLEKREMFESEEDDSWWNRWWHPRGNSKTPPPEYKKSVPLEALPSVEAIQDSTTRFVVDSHGMKQQYISVEPLGHPRVSFHQNHYAAPTAPGTPLGSVDFNFRDDFAASIQAQVDEDWTKTSHPTGFSFFTTQAGSTNPRFPALSLRSDGRMAVAGGPTAFKNPLVSLGVYRNGIFELPKVETYEELLRSKDRPYSPDETPSGPEPFVNGAIVYVKDLDRILVSQGGSWHAIQTIPVSTILPKPQRRVMGAPRADGQPPVFGPRTPFPFRP